MALCSSETQVDPPGGAYLNAYASIVGAWRGGARIAEWNPDTGKLWPPLRAALQTPVSAFVWWQGEEDAGLGLWPVGAYLAELRGLVGRVRHAAHQPRLLVVIVELGPTYRASSTVAEQRQFVETDAHAVFVRTGDLPYRDGTHMAPDGYRAVAQRIAQRIMAQGRSR